MAFYVNLFEEEGGGDGPSQFVKSTSIDGTTSVTFVDQDNTSTTFTPEGGGGGPADIPDAPAKLADEAAYNLTTGTAEIPAVLATASEFDLTFVVDSDNNNDFIALQQDNTVISDLFSGLTDTTATQTFVTLRLGGSNADAIGGFFDTTLRLSIADSASKTPAQIVPLFVTAFNNIAVDGVDTTLVVNAQGGTDGLIWNVARKYEASDAGGGVLNFKNLTLGTTTYTVNITQDTWGAGDTSLIANTNGTDIVDAIPATDNTWTTPIGEVNNLITWSDTDVIALYDQRVFDEKLYINSTGTVTADNPSIDTTNWFLVGRYDVEIDRLLQYDENETTSIGDQRVFENKLYDKITDTNPTTNPDVDTVNWVQTGIDNTQRQAIIDNTAKVTYPMADSDKLATYPVATGNTDKILKSDGTDWLPVDETGGGGTTVSVDGSVVADPNLIFSNNITATVVGSNVTIDVTGGGSGYTNAFANTPDLLTKVALFLGTPGTEVVNSDDQLTYTPYTTNSVEFYFFPNRDSGKGQWSDNTNPVDASATTWNLIG